MNYKQKYLKYKKKYILLKGGELPSCIVGEIFDLDCILPITKNVNDDYIFSKRLSAGTIEMIRDNIQNYYKYFYNFIMFPNLPYENLKTNELREEIIIPLIKREEIVNNKKLNLDYVDYDIMAKKLKNIDIINTLKLYDKLEILVEDYKNYIKNIISDNTDLDFKILKTDIENISTKRTDFTILIKNIYNKIIDLKNDLYKDIIKPKFVKYTNEQIEKNKIEEKQIKEKRDRIDEIYKFIKKIYDDIIDINNKINNISYINIINKLLKYNNTEDIRSMFDNKKKEICNNILKKFQEKNNLNTQIISVNIKFFSNNETELDQEEDGHANSVTIYKFKKNGMDSYLCLRTEPHRHTNIYCRNSVRKAIRDIFTYLPNSYYLDFIINSREGLQINEELDIEKENLSDFDDIPQNIRKLSPLQGNSGFCASWTVYSLLLLMLNRDKPLNNIGSYFATFNLNLNNKTKSEQFREEYDKCYKDPLIVKDTSCKAKNIFEKEFKEYIEFKENTGSYKIKSENIVKYKYILIKHIKLYRTILFVLYFITRKLNIKEIYNKINDSDRNILNNIFEKFDQNNIMNIIHDKLKSNDSIKLNISDDILNKDTHKCDDNIYDHKEFCQEDDLNKPIDFNPKFNCVDSKYKFIDTDNKTKIKLKGLKTTMNESESEFINEFNRTRENISYVINNL
jgi:hypothetical protein